MGGELAIGGTDPKHYDQSKLEYVSLTSETYWQFKMSGLVEDNSTTRDLYCCEMIFAIFLPLDFLLMCFVCLKTYFLVLQ